VALAGPQGPAAGPQPELRVNLPVPVTLSCASESVSQTEPREPEPVRLSTRATVSRAAPAPAVLYRAGSWQMPQAKALQQTWPGRPGSLVAAARPDWYCAGTAERRARVP